VSAVAELLALRFAELDGADATLRALRNRTDAGYPWADDVVVVEQHHSGRVGVAAPTSSLGSTRRWAEVGALLALWWFPPSWTTATWLHDVGLVARVDELVAAAGLAPELADQIRQALTPGSSMLVLVGATGDVTELRTLATDGTTVVDEAVPAEAVEHLRGALVPPTPEPSSS
jgi:hypothetical protein